MINKPSNHPLFHLVRALVIYEDDIFTRYHAVECKTGLSNRHLRGFMLRRNVKMLLYIGHLLTNRGLGLTGSQKKAKKYQLLTLHDGLDPEGDGVRHGGLLGRRAARVGADEEVNGRARPRRIRRRRSRSRFHARVLPAEGAVGGRGEGALQREEGPRVIPRGGTVPQDPGEALERGRHGERRVVRGQRNRRPFSRDVHF